jgi:hypothetical protein
MNNKVNLKDKTVCFIDNGLFLEMAITVSKDFGRTLYFSYWTNAFPKSNGALIGDGLEDEGIERINYLFDYIDEVDLFVMPDIYDSDLALHLESLGKRVFSSRKGDELELLRMEAKRHFKKLGQPVQPVKEVLGLEALRKHLMTHENKYVKISTYRGDFETFHAINFRLTEPILDELEYKLGARQFTTKFVVEDAIDGDDIVETGYDGYCIDGQFPDKAIQGYEIKDLGYVGMVKEYAKMSPLITGFNEAISETMSNYNYRNFFSTEIRVGKDKIPYMIDFCARCGSPPNELYQTMMTNLAEIMWHGSVGTLVQPEFCCQYGIEVMIHSDWADTHWQAIHIDPSIRKWVKLRNLTKINGTYYIVPHEQGLPEIGAVVAIGNSVEECVKKVKSYAEKIEGYRLDIKTGSIEAMNEVVAKGEKLGIKFG